LPQRDREPVVGERRAFVHHRARTLRKVVRGSHRSHSSHAHRFVVPGLDPDDERRTMSTITKVFAGAAVIVAAALGGAAVAGAAQPQGSTSTSSSDAPAAAAPKWPVHGSAAHEDAERTVTGSAAAQAKAAAVKFLGGGTAGAVTTDYRGGGYEVTVTRADGTSTEVHLDSSFNPIEGRGFGA
jgi:hypothetical protein